MYCSSRFTDSEKYESEFSNCFLLDETREGDICNACVLVVKRWKNLPKDTKKNWAHVVDARNGPGNKHITKLKKKDDEIEKFEKIRKKRKNKISSRKLFGKRHYERGRRQKNPLGLLTFSRPFVDSSG